MSNSGIFQSVYDKKWKYSATEKEIEIDHCFTAYKGYGDYNNGQWGYIDNLMFIVVDNTSSKNDICRVEMILE